MSRNPVSALALLAVLSGTAALAEEPVQKPSSVSQSIDTGLKDAQTKRLAGDYGAAVKVLSQLMLVSADDPRVVTEYGKVLIAQGRSREALDFLKRAAQLNGNDWTVFSALGVAYDASGDYANAKNAYEQALVLKPGAPAALNNYALSRAMAGDSAQAKSLIEEASKAGSDPRIVSNLKMIASLPAAKADKASASAQRPAAKPVPVVNGKPVLEAKAPPRTLTSAEGKQVVMQAVPADPLAGPVKKRKAAKPEQKTAKQSDAIPALRLANDKL